MRGSTNPKKIIIYQSRKLLIIITAYNKKIMSHEVMVLFYFRSNESPLQLLKS